ncbi:hypothetical protein [Methylocella sp.]|jgi:hypothetical protein|uniref:hypothetical protein n=1 Tax=Methylocella sp. TaxID=1978226 RepID=UPI003C17EDC5
MTETENVNESAQDLATDLASLRADIAKLTDSMTTLVKADNGAQGGVEGPGALGSSALAKHNVLYVTLIFCAQTFARRRH